MFIIEFRVNKQTNKKNTCVFRAIGLNGATLAITSKLRFRSVVYIIIAVNSRMKIWSENQNFIVCERKNKNRNDHFPE